MSNKNEKVEIMKFYIIATKKKQEKQQQLKQNKKITKK